MERLAFKQLLKWKDKPGRKPLIIRGARQVGKTFLVKEFGKTSFRRYHYLNFENNRKADLIFHENLDPKVILGQLELLLSETIDPKHDLVIFDEIQESPRALTSLKYFQEEMPELALVSAGSLLGVHLSRGSFPVGKVDFLDMFPMTFHEFLMALNETRLLSYLNDLDGDHPLPLILHDMLWQKLLIYFVVGGLPEAVKIFIAKKDHLYEAFSEVREKQKVLLIAYTADMAKHSGKVNSLQLERLWRAVPSQLAQLDDEATHRFMFKDVIPGANRYQQLVGAIDWLEAAGLIIKVKIAHSAQIPFSAFTKENIFKLYVFDIGLLGALSDLNPKILLDQTYGTYKGYIAENYVAQEFCARGFAPLYAWHEKMAEVEFLKSLDGGVVPIEVKSGKQTKAKSLSVFREKYRPPYEIVFSGMNREVRGTRRKLPLYLTGWFNF